MACAESSIPHVPVLVWGTYKRFLAEAGEVRGGPALRKNLMLVLSGWTKKKTSFYLDFYLPI